MPVKRTEMEKKNEFYSYLKQAGIYTVIPLILALGPIIGYYIGSFLDRKFHTEPFLMILFLTFGFIAAGREVYNLTKRAMKDSENNK
jgi:ATP synthase protein I